MTSDSLRPLGQAGLETLEALGFTVSLQPAPTLVGGRSLESPVGDHASLAGAASFCRRVGLRVDGKGLLRVQSLLEEKLPPHEILARLRADPR